MFDLHIRLLFDSLLFSGFMDRKSLRRDLNRRRIALHLEHQREASRRVAQRALHLPEYRRSRRIAAYIAVRGEVECSPIIASAWHSGRSVCVPAINRGEMVFVPYVPGDTLIPKRFGIPEPLRARRLIIRPRDVDVVFCPLLAFDSAGTRLGMGGGYYDRCLHFLARQKRWRHPLLIGLAYEMQHVPLLERFPWDVPLHAAVTESSVYRF